MKTHCKRKYYPISAFIIIIAMLLNVACNMSNSTNNVSLNESIKQYHQFSNYTEDREEYTIPAEDGIYDDLVGFKKVADNSFLELFFNEVSASIAVVDKRSKKITFSSPPGTDNDSVAIPEMKEQMKAALMVTYFHNSAQRTMNSYTSSVKNEMFDYQLIENGIKVTFNMADSQITIDDIPQKISDERFRLFFLENENLGQNDLIRINRYYKLDETNMIWEFTDTRSSTINLMGRILQNAGYTYEDLLVDNEEHGIVTDIFARVFFNIPVELYLEHESLIVEISSTEMEYNPNVPPLSIRLFELFGAQKADTQGYIFIPDGSGALIDFRENRKRSNTYGSIIYGRDRTLSPNNRPTEFLQTNMPVFGIHSDEVSFIAIIEDADAISAINAYESGQFNSYYSVFSNFRLTESENVVIGHGSQTSRVRAFQRKPYEGHIRVRYAFLSPESNGFVYMAKYYRNYVVSKYNLELIDNANPIPLILEILGGIKKTKSFLGINYEGVESLTTFKQSIDILRELKDNGVLNINLLLNGWITGGINHASLRNAKPLSVLGGRRDFYELVDYTNLNSIDFYPLINSQTVPQGGLGYNPYTQSAKRIDQRIAFAFDYDIVTNNSTNRYHVVSSENIPSNLERFKKRILNREVSGIGINDWGNQINADYSARAQIDRQDTLNFIVNNAKSIQESDMKLMIRNSPVPILPNIDLAVEIPSKSNSLPIITRDIPFFQIAFHGYLDYSTTPLNSSYDIQKEIVRNIRLGNLPYFVVMNAKGETTKGTEYSYYFSNEFSLWSERIIEIYSYTNEILSNVRGETIEQYENPVDDLYIITYSNGVNIFINESRDSVAFEEMLLSGYQIKVKGVE